MNMIQKFLIRLVLVLSVCFVFGSASLSAQEQSVFIDWQRHFELGEYFFGEGLFGQAQQEFDHVINDDRAAHEGQSEYIKTMSKFRSAVCGVRLKQPDSEKRILEFIREQQPGVIASEASFEMGRYYFSTSKNDQVIQFLDGVDTRNLTNEEQLEYYFMLGYANFVKKKFAPSKKAFVQVKEIKSQYYYPSNYYYGIIEFFEEDYNAALTSFKKVETSKKYSRIVPYYISQILFAQKKYDEVISYGEPFIGKTGVLNQKELHQLVGQSYYEQKNFQAALPHLEAYASQSSNMREDEIYLLAQTQFQNGKYDAALENYEQLSLLESEMGQAAMFSLAEIQLQKNNRPAARIAFERAKGMNYDPVVQKEAEFQYGKLSAELGYTTDAIGVLSTIDNSSPYYLESQRLLTNLFLNTEDYSSALDVLESIPNKTLDLRETYQIVAYRKGIELFAERKYAAAKSHFILSLKEPHDPTTKALALFWSGDADYRMKNYAASNQALNKYLPAARNLSQLPIKSSIPMANYIIGYTEIENKNYSAALRAFDNSVSGFEKRRSQDPAIKQRIFPDAVVRLADMHLLMQNIPSAKASYERVVRLDGLGKEYALFRLARVEKLQNNLPTALLYYEQIASQQPPGDYADDALYEQASIEGLIDSKGKSLQTLQSFLQRFPSSPLKNEVLIKAGLTSYNLDQEDLAIGYYKDVFKNNPSPDESESARQALEMIYTENGNTSEYISFLQSIGMNATVVLQDSLSFYTAKNMYERGEYSAAITRFSTYLDNFSNGIYSIEALYKRAKSYEYIVPKDSLAALADYEALVSRGNSQYLSSGSKQAARIAYDSRQFSKAYTYAEIYERSASSESERNAARLTMIRSAYFNNDVSKISPVANRIFSSDDLDQDVRNETHLYLGRLYMQENKIEDAKLNFEIVEKGAQQTWQYEAGYNLAYIQFYKRDYDGSFEKAASIFPGMSDLYWKAKIGILISILYIQKDELLNAEAMLKTLLEKYTYEDEVRQEAKDLLRNVRKRIQAQSKVRPTEDESDDIQLEKPIEDE